MWGGNVPDGPLEAREPVEIGECLQCGGEVYDNEEAYESCLGLVHDECMGDYILDKIGTYVVAMEFGYQKRNAAL